MILFILKSRLFKCAVYFFIGIIISGCSSQFFVRDFNDSGINASSVLKVYLNNGQRIDMGDKGDMNQLIKLNNNELTYATSNGDFYTVLTKDISNCLEKRFSLMDTILLVLGSIVFSLAVFLAIALHDFHGVG